MTSNCVDSVRSTAIRFTSVRLTEVSFGLVPCLCSLLQLGCHPSLMPLGSRLWVIISHGVSGIRLSNKLNQVYVTYLVPRSSVALLSRKKLSHKSWCTFQIHRIKSCGNSGLPRSQWRSRCLCWKGGKVKGCFDFRVVRMRYPPPRAAAPDDVTTRMLLVLLALLGLHAGISGETDTQRTQSEPSRDQIHTLMRFIRLRWILSQSDFDTAIYWRNPTNISEALFQISIYYIRFKSCCVETLR